MAKTTVDPHEALDEAQDEASLDADVIIVGAGMAGLYAVKVLRERGRRVLVLERGAGVGGTWFWNRYPGARCDIPSMEYSFGFDPELEQEWVWTEHFASQPEIERYLNHLADRYDLRRDIRLDTGVDAMDYDERARRWSVRTEHGDTLHARWCVMATGGLSAPNRPDIPGIDSFTGTILQTSQWPEEDVDLTGRRVAVIGTGSSGVQTIPEVAKVAEHLTVLQRTPAFTWPSRNRLLDDAEQNRIKAEYRDLRRQQQASYSGTAGTTGAVIFEFPTDDRRILDSTEAEREAVLAEHGFSACRIWADTAKDLDANAMAVELFGEMVRRTIRDPELAESLTPSHPLGCKRPVLDTDYFETFNRDNVTLVDLRKGGIEEITPGGIRTAQGDVDADVIVFATGFDALTGALTRIDLRGRDGRLLRDDWAEGPQTYLGLGVEGYPNMFVLVGPGSPGVLATYPTQIELQVGWLADFLDELATRGVTEVEVQAEAQAAWTEHVDAMSVGTMFVVPSCNSWYTGANIEGKPRVFLPYAGGLPQYMAKCNEAAAAGYAGFTLR